MILMLLSGMFFLLMDHRRLMFLSLLCCGVLCVFLKNRSNSDLRLAEDSSQPSISVAQINLVNIAEDYEGLIESIKQDSVDLICFQEVTPDWASFIQDELNEVYPFANSLVRIDPFGQLILSKYPLSAIDTFYHEGIPVLSSLIDLGYNIHLQLISLHPKPIVSDESNSRFEQHLDQISKKVLESKIPLITIGDFNIVPWSDEIQKFKYLSNLNDCRREFVPASPLNPFNFHKIPVEHIFYNDRLECVSFNNLRSAQRDYLGIKGKYQFINSITRN